MCSIRKYLIPLCIVLCTQLQAQTTQDTILAKDNVMIPLPTIGINFGFNHAFTDVKLAGSRPSAFQQFGYQLTITQRVTKFLNASLNIYAGTIYGEQQINETNLNFKTTLFSQHINVEYNFYPLLVPKENGRQLIRPYVGLGLGVLSFRSKGDLKDEKGRAYHYWSDGNIYEEEEGTIAVSNATSLQRDRIYETDLRDANLDGLRKYPQTAFSLPLNAGIRFQITKNIGVNAAFTYAFNFTDLLDNVSDAGSGARKGRSGNDNHLFGSIGLNVFLGNTKPSAKSRRGKPELLADEDTTPIPDSDTPIAVAVDSSKTDILPETVEQIETPVSQPVQQPKTVPTSEDKLLTISATRKNAERLLKRSETLQFESTALIRQLSRSENPRKEDMEKVQSILAQQDELSNAIQKLISSSETQNKQVPSSTSDVPPQTSVNVANTQESLTMKEAIEKLEQVNKEISSDQAELSTELTVLRTEESKLNEWAVLQAKVRLIEKMKDRRTTGSMSEDDLSVTLKNLDSELKVLRSDTLLATLVPATELALVEKRVAIMHTSEEPSEISAETSTSLNNTTSSQETPKKDKSQDNSEAGKTRATPSIKEIERSAPKQPGGFMWADVNGNGWISPDEVLHFIDLLFDGEAERSVEDIQNLIDYYFEQE